MSGDVVLLVELRGGVILLVDEGDERVGLGTVAPVDPVDPVEAVVVRSDERDVVAVVDRAPVAAP